MARNTPHNVVLKAWRQRVAREEKLLRKASMPHEILRTIVRNKQNIPQTCPLPAAPRPPPPAPRRQVQPRAASGRTPRYLSSGQGWMAVKFSQEWKN